MTRERSAGSASTDRRTVLKGIGAATGSLIGMGASTGSAAAAGSYTRHSYGGLDYTKYVPDSVQDPAPLLVMLHGCTQDADQFKNETQMNQQADDHGFVVIYPEQSSSRHSNNCWQWFNDQNTTRGNGEVAIIKGMVDQVKSNHSIDGDNVFAAGLSAGAAMVPNLVVEYSDVFSSGAVHSGLHYEVAESEQPNALLAMYNCSHDTGPVAAGDKAYNRMQDHSAVQNQKFTVWHGKDDTTVDPCNADKVAERSTVTYDWTDNGSDDGSTDYSADQTTSDCSATDCVEIYEYHDSSGETVVKKNLVSGMGHAWSGGASGGEYTNPDGPNASERIWNFFVSDTEPPGNGDGNNAPTANAHASPNPADPGETITFDGSNSEDNDGSIQEYEWDLGDGTTKYGETITHSYSDVGRYTIELTVTDDDGATGTDTDTVDVEDTSFDGYCGLDDNYSHVQADRAWTDGSYAYCEGSDQKMGLYNTFERARIREMEPGYFELVEACPD